MLFTEAAEQHGHGATNHVTRSDKIEMLTDRVLNWLSFTHASDYRFRPIAMMVAIKLDDMGVETDTLTKEPMEKALEGSEIQALWSALNPTPPPKLPKLPTADEVRNLTAKEAVALFRSMNDNDEQRQEM